MVWDLRISYVSPWVPQVCLPIVCVMFPIHSEVCYCFLPMELSFSFPQSTFFSTCLGLIDIKQKEKKNNFDMFYMQGNIIDIVFTIRNHLHCIQLECLCQQFSVYMHACSALIMHRFICTFFRALLFLLADSNLALSCLVSGDSKQFFFTTQIHWIFLCVCALV